MYRLLRAVLFIFDAEMVHNLTMKLFTWILRLRIIRYLVQRYYHYRHPILKQHLWGLTIKNPVGLAAGFDKDGKYINALGALGFGAIEVGTITAQGQPGNPRPRLFRLPSDKALLNRMGFNNDGSLVASRRLAATDIEPLIGINIGKSKVTPLEEAPLDYELSFNRLYDFGKYFVVNVSSPNTPGLRQLQEKVPLQNLLSHLQTLNRNYAETRKVQPKPLLLKIAPDITEEQLDDVLDVVKMCNISGIIATNTTISREGLHTLDLDTLGSGGISGKPLQESALACVRMIYRKTGGQLPIIGVGGIFSAEDAIAMIEAGASLIQVWTGFIYEGPALAKRINQGLVRLCEERGYQNISQAVGAKAGPLLLPSSVGPVACAAAMDGEP